MHEMRTWGYLMQRAAHVIEHQQAMIDALTVAKLDANRRAQSSALDALAAMDQASEAYAAQLAAEAALKEHMSRK